MTNSKNKKLNPLVRRRELQYINKRLNKDRFVKDVMKSF